MGLGIAKLLIDPIASILDKVIPDADTRATLAHSIATMAETHAQAIMLAQIEVNKIEAQSDKWWKAGWRPFVGWTCGIALFNNFIIMPYVPGSHEIDLLPLLGLLGGMLGLGTMRTFEKKNGVSRG